MIDLHECGLCFRMLTVDESFHANLLFAYDRTNNGERRVCKDREACAERRAARFGYLKSAPAAR